MAKYSYDKKALKGLGVGAFLGEVKTRNAMIAQAPDTMPVSEFNANALAKALHPAVQHARVASVTEHKGAKSFVLVPDEEAGTAALAYFRAGQYVCVALEIDGTTVMKPYTIRSAPKDALGEKDTSYTLTVKHSPGGFASEYILGSWTVGTKVTLSGPQGEFYYTALRDAQRVVALAGGSGITPFYSMACAIADGTENFDLTILYGSRCADGILLEQELREVAERSGGRVKVIHVLSDEEREGYEHGLITAELIKKYAPDGDYSLFMCGPAAMYRYEDEQTAVLGLKRRRVRKELSGEHGDPTGDAAYPKEHAGRSYSLTVIIRGKSTTLSCSAEQTLLSAIEQAGIHAPSRCRSGQCGWCRSRLVSGELYIPEDADGRRLADYKFGWVHPCCSYPLSDTTLEIFPVQ